MITKARLKKQLDKFPEEFAIDELIDRLAFIEKLEKRIEQSKGDDSITEDELEKEMQEWFK